MPNSPRQLKFGAILTGVGTAQNEWLHPQIPGNASVDIDWYRAQAQQAEHSAPRLGSVCPYAGLNPWVTRQDAGLAAPRHGWRVAAAHGFKPAFGQRV